MDLGYIIAIVIFGKKRKNLLNKFDEKNIKN